MSELTAVAAQVIEDLSILATQAMRELSNLHVLYLAGPGVLLVGIVAFGAWMVRRAVRRVTEKMKARAEQKRFDQLVAEAPRSPYCAGWPKTLATIREFLPVEHQQPFVDALAGLGEHGLDDAWHETLEEVLPQLPNDHRQTFLDAIADLGNYNLLQPSGPGNPVPGGASARRRQWHRIAGGQAGKLDLTWIGMGALVGGSLGVVLGIQPPPIVEGVPMISLVLGIVARGSRRDMRSFLQGNVGRVS